MHYILFIGWLEREFLALRFVMDTKIVSFLWYVYVVPENGFFVIYGNFIDFKDTGLVYR